MSILNEFETAVDRFEEAIDSLKQTCDVGVARLGEFEEAIAAILQLPGEILASSEQSLERVADRFESFYESLSEDVVDKREALESLAESAVEQLESHFDALQETAEEVREVVVDQFEVAWKDAVDEILNETKDQLIATIEDKCTDFSKTGEILKESIEKSMENLRKFVADELACRVTKEGEKTMHSAIDRAQREVVEGIATSQIQIQLTAMMAPFIPPLVVAKMVAPIIRQLLAILRMGF